MWRSDCEDHFRGSIKEEQPRCSRASFDQGGDTIKTVEIDTSSWPYSYTAPKKLRRPSQKQGPWVDSVPSPLYRKDQNLLINTPSPYKTKPLQVNSAQTTPTLRSACYHEMGNAPPKPNYMAATASAMARIRSQSAPRQRAVSPDTEKLGLLAKKRLSFFPIPNPEDSGVGTSTEVSATDYNLRNPNCKSACKGDQRSNLSSSYYNHSSGEEVSSPSHWQC